MYFGIIKYQSVSVIAITCFPFLVPTRSVITTEFWPSVLLKIEIITGDTYQLRH